MPSDPQPLGPRFQIVGRLGSGAAGTVYRAIDTSLQREVAVKILNAFGDEASARFRREAQAAARLRHANIVAIYDVGQVGDQLFIVQEMLRGQPLDALLKARVRIPLPNALDLLIQMASALESAHALGVVHRDFKPANIFILPNGTAKLLDFGIAKLMDQSSLTLVGYVGTPAYSSPEQLAGDNVDFRADIFSFGIVAFEIFSGERLFDSASLPATVHQILYGEIPRLRDRVRDTPEEIEAIVAKCLSRNANERPASMTMVLSRLREARARVGEASPPESWLPQASAAGETSSDSVSRPQPSDEPPPSAEPPAEAPLEVSVEDSATNQNISTGTMIGPVLAPSRDAPATDFGHTAPGQTTPGIPQPASGHASASDLLLDGARIGKFTVHELVAPGQTGHLYKAFDPVRSRLIGLKVIHNISGATVGRLLRASRIWVDLHHPNLQRILEVGPGDTSCPAYVATELIEGVDLHTLLARRQLDLAQKIDIALQLCDALEYLHDQGIVHREVTPRNIVITESPLRVTLLDSGLARPSAIDGPNLTVTGVIIGDFQYMAPEQTQGRYDQRSDVYSVGVVLYEMALGKRFKPERSAIAPAGPMKTMEMLRKELEQSAVVPPKLASTLLAALQPDPALRYGSAREMADALRPLVPHKLPALNLSTVVVTVHGIRTHARWQRAFSETASRNGLHCKLDRWNFGYFSVFHFLTPWSRQAKVRWFRGVYHDEFGEQVSAPLSSERPSVVAHSFGAYILGNALLRYPYLRFNKVLLCGSILPDDFPWDALIDRGQVQAVRNEYGARDTWTRMAQWFVPGTGPSGQSAFRMTHDRLEQERFDYSHSEYFEKGHMSDNWLPFLKRRLSHITPRDRDVRTPVGARPFGLYMLYTLLALLVVVALRWISTRGV